MTDSPAGRSVGSEFLPKRPTVWREGCGLADLRAEALAGRNVAIVALPLPVAIASGVGPGRGRSTAIGVPGLILATFRSGLVLIAAGLPRFGTDVRRVPYPVTIGFTAGIAVIVFASQLRELFGLTLPGAEPGEILAKAQALWAARGTVTWAAVAVAVRTAAGIAGLKRLRPHWPGMLHALFLPAFLPVAAPLAAAPLAAFVPLAALAGVLAVVAWGIAERHEVAALLRAPRGAGLVVSVTFLLVVCRDLTAGDRGRPRAGGSGVH